MKLINGEDYNPITPEVEAHFQNPFNYTDAIIGQFHDQIYQRFIKGRDLVILDIGANVGLFAVHVSPMAKYILCVEPTPSHFDKNRIITGPFPQIDRINVALSDHTGKDEFYFCEVNTTMNSLDVRMDGQLTVDCVDMAKLVDTVLLTSGAKKIDFVKIDIEGSEVKAITENTMRPVMDKLKAVYMELHHWPEETLHERMKTLFELLGFTVQEYSHDHIFATKD